MYDHGPPEEAERALYWSGGVSWIAHPAETGRRAGHAVKTDSGVWLVDPLDATNLGELLDPLGPVVGVAVCSSWHTRDADVLARRHGGTTRSTGCFPRRQGVTDEKLIASYGVGPETKDSWHEHGERGRL